MILNDFQIAKLAAKGMIEPFEPRQVRGVDSNGVPYFGKDPFERVISWGLSSFGYDARLAYDFKVFTNVHSTVVDPKNFDPKAFVELRSVDTCVIPPNSFVLGHTLEYFRIPKDVCTDCLGKSTYARCGIVVNVTPFEPGWEGEATLEFSNTTPLPAILYAGEGCCQIRFFQGETPEVTYDQRNGKYQGQRGVVLPRL